MPAKSRPAKTYSTKHFRIGRSRTGLGLFATRAFRKGQTVVEYSGRRITTKESNRLEDEGRNSYLFEINRQWTIDGSTRKNLARYVNHSCKPNADAIMRRGTRRLEYAASRWIEPGEEVTVDYGKDYYNILMEEGGCQCAYCRGKKARKRKKQREERAAKKVRAAKRRAGKKRGRR
jgi:SET domain-containing protein